MSALLAFGCSSIQEKSDRAIGLSDICSARQKSGLILESSRVKRFSLKITKIIDGAKFTQIVPLLPGEDLRKAYQPAEISTENDSIIGVGGKVDWNSAEELASAVESAYSKDSFTGIQIANDKTAVIRTIITGDKHRRSDLEIAPEWHMNFLNSKVYGVIPGSWAEKSGLRAGDEIAGALEFQSAEIQRSHIPLMNYSRKENQVETADSDEIVKIYGFLDKMFQDIKPYKPISGHKDGLMGYAALLRVMIVRNGKIEHKNLVNSRYVGVGAQFPCFPYCGKAKPVIKALLENSSGYRAGFQLEDLVISINGKKVHNSWDTVQYIRRFNFGDELTFMVLRNGQPVKVKTTLDWVIEDN